MTNFLYTAIRVAFLNSSGPDLSSADTRAILYDAADDTPSTADDFLDDVLGASRVATSASAIGGNATTGGVFDLADETFSAVTGDQSEGLIVYQHTGTEATSALLAHFDTGITGIPVTPNGGDITVTWNASGVFSVGG